MDVKYAAFLCFIYLWIKYFELIDGGEKQGVTSPPVESETQL